MAKNKNATNLNPINIPKLHNQGIILCSCSCKKNQLKSRITLSQQTGKRGKYAKSTQNVKQSLSANENSQKELNLKENINDEKKIILK